MFFIEEFCNNRFIKVEKCLLQCCGYNVSVELGACGMRTLKDSVIIFFFFIPSFLVFRTTLDCYHLSCFSLLAVWTRVLFNENIVLPEFFCAHQCDCHKDACIFDKAEVAKVIVLPNFTYCNSEYRDIKVRCAQSFETFSIKYREVNLYSHWECKVTRFCMFSSCQLSLQIGY